MGVHNLQSTTQFREALVNDPHTTILIDCFSRDSLPSKHIAPEYVSLSNEPKFSSILFAKLDVDQVPTLAEELGIKDLPCVILYKDGEVKGRVSAVGVEELREFVEKAL